MNSYWQRFEREEEVLYAKPEHWTDCHWLDEVSDREPVDKDDPKADQYVTMKGDWGGKTVQGSAVLILVDGKYEIEEVTDIEVTNHNGIYFLP